MYLPALPVISAQFGVPAGSAREDDAQRTYILLGVLRWSAYL